MSAPQFTPGPWRVDLVKPHQVCLNAEKTRFIRVASANPQWSNCAANANLIAAAPELYEALLEVQQYPLPERTERNIAAALAKARGEQA